MMENIRYNSFEDKQFKELLDECYFHPSRKYESDEIKFIARSAMQLLWDMDGILVHGIYFSKADIRDRMINEMSCDDLDRAIAEASAKKWNIKFVDFLVMILWHVLYCIYRSRKVWCSPLGNQCRGGYCTGCGVCPSLWSEGLCNAQYPALRPRVGGGS